MPSRLVPIAYETYENECMSNHRTSEDGKNIFGRHFRLVKWTLQNICYRLAFPRPWRILRNKISLSDLVENLSYW